jgi:hypothetical protein
MATIHEITEDWIGKVQPPTLAKLQAAIAEFDALAADAARYRWLCEHQIVPSPSLWDDGIGFVCKLNGLTRRGTAEKATLDAAIDAAMKGE